MSDYNNWNNPQYVEAYREAERKVKSRLGFYWHLASYLAVNGMLVAIYFLGAWSSGEYYPWFVWPMLGWGVGLLLHFIGVFVIFDTPANRQRMIEKELRQMGVASPTMPDLRSRPAIYPQDYNSPAIPPQANESLNVGASQNGQPTL